MANPYSYFNRIMPNSHYGSTFYLLECIKKFSMENKSTNIAALFQCHPRLLHYNPLTTLFLTSAVQGGWLVTLLFCVQL